MKRKDVSTAINKNDINKVNSKQKVDPIGSPQIVDLTEEVIDETIKQWDENKPDTKKKWWHFFIDNKRDIFDAVRLLISALEKLIMAAEKSVVPITQAGELISTQSMAGPDKKATVLAGLAVIYDYIKDDILTGWLKIWANQIRFLVIYVIFPTSIDWIVGKYNDNSWNMPSQELNKEYGEVIGKVIDE